MDEEGLRPLEQIAGTVDVAEQADRALDFERFIRALWAEVRALPLKQRWAFLLHAERDELLALIEHGCRSLRQLAIVLGVAPEELTEWFSQLPLPDDRIAERLGVTRRQVINLRKCARERLGRRLKMWEGG